MPICIIVPRKESFKNKEIINRHKNGKLVAHETRGKPIFDAKGIFSEYRGVDRDITERKRVVETVLQLRKAMEASGEIILTTNPEGIITYANSATSSQAPTISKSSPPA